MVTDIFGVLMIHSLETADVLLLFVKLRYFSRFTYSFVLFSCEIYKSVDQLANLIIVVTSIKKVDGNEKLKGVI